MPIHGGRVLVDSLATGVTRKEDAHVGITETIAFLIRSARASKPGEQGFLSPSRMEALSQPSQLVL